MSAGTVTPRERGLAAAPTRGEEIRRFAHLTYTLAITEWKLRFFGSVLGYLWTLARPLLFFGVLYVVFSHVAKVGDAIKHYPVLLLTGIVLFNFFTEATGFAVRCLVDRETLLRKVRFPRMVIPLSVVLTAAFNLGTNLVVVLVFVLANGIEPRWEWLEMIPLAGMLVLLATGFALTLATWYVRYRDVAPIWEVSSQALFYGSPVFYTIDFFGSAAQVISWTPLAMILTQMRHALIDPSAPTAAEVAGGTVYLLIPIGITLAIFAFGVRTFLKASPRLAEEL
jgi:ABC-2 type transport system permease protein